MPEDQIEMLWRCGDSGCNHENKGRYKTCMRCGRPKTEEDGFYMPGNISHEAAVTDEQELAHAKGGKDWLCRYCGSRQFRADGVCSNCGVDMETGEKRVTADPTVVEVMEATARWKEPLIRSLARLQALKGIFAGLLGLVLILGLLKACSPRVVDATVSGVSWKTVVHVELYSKHWYEGFSPDIDAIDLVPQGVHVHHYDHVWVGSHKEPYNHHYSCGQSCRDVPRSCYTTSRSCKSNKNGYATCTGGDKVCTGGGQSCSTKYCDETLYKTVDDYTDIPQYAPYFSWNRWEWAHEKDLPMTGLDYTPLYDGLPPSDTERESGRDITLNVGFTNGKESWTYHPSLGEFAQYSLGSHRKIKVGMLGVTVLP
jgi:hypothetical protein